jgi:hypothetical protein
MFRRSLRPEREPGEAHEFGRIQYWSGETCHLRVPTFVGSTYNIDFAGQQGIHGLHIPSHRPIYQYQPVSQISTRVVSRTNAFQQYRQSTLQRYQGSHSEHSENYYIKEALISLATFGYGNEVIPRDAVAVNLFEGFERILRLVLPKSLGFRRIAVRMPEVVLETTSGVFSLDAVSGGIASVIDLAWQLYMYDAPSFVVTFDEPENHLHPEMQKTLLPNFLEAFPHIQFIVATHNPFIISSTPDSFVYVLNYNSPHRVDSVRLEDVDKSGTANDILREVLGIATTMPNWVDEKLESIIREYSTSGITAENIHAFKASLESVGLGKYVHTSVADLIEESKKR